MSSAPPVDDGNENPMQRLIDVVDYEKVTGRVVGKDDLGESLLGWAKKKQIPVSFLSPNREQDFNVD